MTNHLTSELICTRLSHDIIGNIGAVANAVELLEEGDMDFLDDIKSILKNSSRTLAARLKFFRMAFGLNNTNLEDAALVKQTAQEYLFTLGNKDYPIRLAFNVAATEKRKPALLMLMVMADLLIRGGDITIQEENGKLSADIPTTAKISSDKLDKIEAAIYTRQPVADAGLAPLFALFEQQNEHKISLVNNEVFIRLVME